MLYFDVFKCKKPLQIIGLKEVDNDRNIGLEHFAEILQFAFMIIFGILITCNLMLELRTKYQ